MSHEWRSKAEIMRVTEWTARHIKRVAKSGGLIVRNSGEIGANHKPVPEYSLSSPALEPFSARLIEMELQSISSPALVPAAPVRKLSPTECHALALRDHQPELFTSPSALIPANSLELNNLTAEQRQQAADRLEAITPLLEWRESPRPFITADQQHVASVNDLVAWIARQRGLHPSAIWKWDSKYRNGGDTPLARFKALADRARKDRGKSRALTIYPKAAEYALVKYLGLAPSQYLEAARHLRLPPECGLDYRMPRYKSERLTITAVYAGIEREWENWYNHGSRPPSYNTIRSFLQGLPDPVKVMAREGERAYENRCERHLKRSYDFPVNSWWVSDHRIFDIFCWNDYFPEFQKERGEWLRVWLTTMEDVRSRRIVGWAFSVNPSSRSVMAAMRMGAMRFGLPTRQVYMDNGEDYKLFAKTLHENFGLEHTPAKPFRPRSKPIESWHATLAERFDPLFGPAYAGHDAKNRSEENTLALKQHRAWREGKAPATPILAVSDLIKLFGAWIENEYNEWPHSGQDMDGLSPRVLFDRELPEAKRRPLDVAQLEPLFWQRETRIVRNSTVQIFSQQYEPADAESDVALRLYNAREVRVACNPDDLAFALAYDAEGPDHKFLARLVAPKLAPYGPLSRDLIAANEKSNAQARNGLRQFQRSLTRRAAAVGYRSELDTLAERAGVIIQAPISPLQLASTNPTPTDTTSPELAGGDRKTGPAFRAAAGAASSGPRYTEDVVERFKAAQSGND